MSDARDRAATVLGLPPSATADEATASFLRSLPDTGYIPTDDMVLAVNALAGQNVPADPNWECEVGLTAEIEEFIRKFWEFDRAGRMVAWTALASRAQDERTLSRLRALLPGLEIGSYTAPDPTSAEIASLARELFLLPPRGRAIRRNEWLVTYAARHAELVQAANEIRRYSPGLVALDPVLFDRLTPHFDAMDFAAAAADEPLEIPPGDLPEPVSKVFEDQLTTPRPIHQPTPRPDREKSGSNYTWLLIFAGIVFVRLVAALGTSSTQSNPPLYHPRSSNVTPQFRRIFSQEEVERFQKHDPASKELPPSGYFEWRLAGMPKGFRSVPAPGRSRRSTSTER